MVGTPNPLGTIYIRLFETDMEPPVVSRDDMVRSGIEAMALMADFPAALRAATERVLFAAFDVLTADEAGVLAELHDDTIATLEAVQP